MHDTREAAGCGPPPAEDPSAVILDILIGLHPGLAHVDEVMRLYARGSIEHTRASPIVEDAISELLANGLAHRPDSFVWVSRAALRALQLTS